MTAYDDTGAQTLAFHREMLDDRKRTDGYLKAILATVRPGDVVLDLGTGTGILAYFAALAGAKRIYAVEQGPVVELARQICEQNGFSEKVVFINDWSTDIDLPEAVDVIVTETIGNAAFDEGIVGTVADARDRFLRGGGRIIPQKLTLEVGLVESSFDYAEVARWGDGRYTIDLSPAQELAANTLWSTDFSPAHVLGEPSISLTVSLIEVSSSTLAARESLAVKRDGTVHGLGCWFKGELSAGIWIDTVPPNGCKSWFHGFLPLAKPIRVEAGDQVHVELEVSENGSRWEWGVGRPGSERPEQRQSTASGASKRIGFLPGGSS